MFLEIWRREKKKDKNKRKDMKNVSTGEIIGILGLKLSVCLFFGTLVGS